MKETNKKIGRTIRLILNNNFHYQGEVLEEDDFSLTLLDRKGVKVCISKDSIMVSEEGVSE